MQLFRSRFNYFVARPEGTVGYNARTGAFCLLRPEVAQLLQGDSPLDSIGDGQATLVECGFIHYGNEIADVLQRFERGRALSRVAHITLVPTMACNYHCDYCYQNAYRTQGIMPLDTQDAALRFIARLIDTGRTDLCCDWYGGEPLLAADIVCSMTTRLKSLAEEKHAKVDRVSLITNGTLLDEETATRLANAGITGAQISLDSLVNKAPIKRGAINSDGSLSVIMQNAVNNHAVIPITIRINVSKENKDEIAQIVAVIKSSGFSGTYYTARVNDDQGEASCGSRSAGQQSATTSASLPVLQSSCCSTLSRPEFASFEWEQITSNPKMIQLVARRLTPKKHFCSATSGEGFVIDPDGNISRCWHSASVPSEAIGSVFNDASCGQNEVNDLWNAYTPLTYPACKTCRVLPLCMGGCSHPRLFMNAQRAPCESIKFQVNACVEAVAKRLDLLHAHASGGGIEAR